MTINWSNKTYTKEELIEAWNSSISLRECLRTLKLKPAGGNYKILKDAAEELNLTRNHMSGQAHNKGKTWKRPIKPLDEVLVENSPTQSNSLKKRLIHAGLLKAECSSCDLSEWMGQPIPIELDHINGDSSDNRIENLRILCPNCHALTPTYRGRNMNGGVRTAKLTKNSLCECGELKQSRSKNCLKCHHLNLKKQFKVT